MTTIEIYPDKKVKVLEDTKTLIRQINLGKKMIKVTRHVFKNANTDKMTRVEQEFYIHADRILTIE